MKLELSLITHTEFFHRPQLTVPTSGSIEDAPDSDAPFTEKLAAAAAEVNRCYPECQDALYRRQYPGWLEERMAFTVEYHDEQHWQGIQR